MTTRTPAKKSSCTFCTAEDNDEMVQCDNKLCKAWTHLKCADLSEERAQQIEWFCDHCYKRKNKICKRCDKPIGDLLKAVDCSKNCGAISHVVCTGIRLKPKQTARNIVWTCLRCQPAFQVRQEVATDKSDGSVSKRTKAMRPVQLFKSKTSPTVMKEPTEVVNVKPTGTIKKTNVLQPVKSFEMKETPTVTNKPVIDTHLSVAVERTEKPQEIDSLKQQAPSIVMNQQTEVVDGMHLGAIKKTNAPQSVKSYGSKASSRARNELAQAKLDVIRQQKKLLEEEKELITYQMDSLSIAPSDLNEEREDDVDKTMVMNRFLNSQSDEEVKNDERADMSKIDPCHDNLDAQQASQSSPNICKQETNQPLNAKSTLTREPFNIERWAARQSIDKKLPTFNGRPEQWPSFIAAYENSNKFCGFSNQDNLTRLQQSIGYPARQAVEKFLYDPDSVPRIIRTLKLMFSQPACLFETHLEDLMKEPAPSIEIPESVLNYATSVQNLWAMLKSNDLESYMSNPLTMNTIINKLPQTLRYDWDFYLKEKKKSKSMTTFIDWLDELIEKVCRLNPTMDFAAYLTKVTKSTNTASANKGVKKNARVNHHQSHDERSQQEKCLACDLLCEALTKCPTFVNMSQEERWALLLSKKICKQCLKKHYLRHPFVCPSRIRCGMLNCNGRHHDLMHRPREEQETTQEIPEVNVNYHSSNEKLLFRYVKVKVRHDSRIIEIGAFLDEGSSGTFIDEELAEQLGATGPKSPLCIHYTSKNSHREANSMTLSLKIQSIHMRAKEYALKGVQTVKDLNLSSQSLDYATLSERYDYLRNLPIHSYYDLKPRLLIGLNNWKLGVPIEVKTGNQGEPMAALCALGWTIFAASANDSDQSVHYCNHVLTETTEERLDDMLKYYYSIESLGVKPPTNDVTSMEERRALTTMKNTMRKQNDNFEVGLLWKHDDIRLPESYEMAMNRLRCLEARMRRNPQLAKSYHEQMQNTIQRGYARRIDPKELNQNLPRKWYLPVFPVENPNKPGKVRNVFDAAAKSNGVSLNDCMLKGPDQNSSLLGVLLRFRERRIGITGDIREMFMQVKIPQPDCYSQLFLYRPNDEAQIDTYVLESMTFGASCSPTVAQFVKNSNAERFINKYPRAVESIVKNHYVDDLLDSVDDEQEAIELIQQIRYIHSEAHFEIRGWKSNSEIVMNEFEKPADNVELLKEEQMQLDKVLGMWWRRSTDILTYTLKYNKCNELVLAGKCKPTKTDVLRTLMSLYDPLGLLSPLTSILKILMQDVWRSGIDWRDTITDEHYFRWLNWLDMLKQVKDLAIPRCYLRHFSNYKDTRIQLHVFMDASRDCCAAVAYLRISHHDEVVVSLVMGKSKVAPIQLMSIPRLELVAAVLGARMSNAILENLSIEVEKVFYWVDSTTVLSWIRSDTRKITGQYEKFRVAEIQDTTKIANWRYINTKSNVADDATKMTRSTINSNDRWFNGPPFLLLKEDEWPQDKIIKTQDDKTIEIHVMVPKVFEPVIRFENFSSWDRLVAVVAYMQRVFIPRHLKPEEPVLSVDELSRAEEFLIKTIQMRAYQEEIKDLEQGKIVSKRSKIRQWSPILIDGILKVDGRTKSIRHASPYAIDPPEPINFDVVNPIILPRDDYGTELVIRKYHERYLHINHLTAYNEMRQRYAIPSLWTRLKYVRRECPRCKLLTARATTPRMADLPPARLATYTRPFTYTGVDCMGPINVTVRRKPEKRWVVLFTCLTTRAVHLEVLNGMDHDSFILAFRCFVNRRGQPNEMFSDNGTNFVKAERLLREDMKLFNNTKLAETMARKGIKWNFNPPEASHMGGVWERLVRSVKQAFYASMPTHSISDPMFRSMMTEIENMLNSRPLTFMPLESEEAEALTPNHFLLGSSSGAKPIGVFDDNAKLLRSNWLNSQLYMRKFWKRWIMEYLPDLSRRTKWFEPAEPLKDGDLVLLINPDDPSYEWQRGRVHAVNQSEDGQVRSAVIKTNTGLLLRPVVKLAKLDVIKSEPESLCDTSGHRGEC